MTEEMPVESANERIKIVLKLSGKAAIRFDRGEFVSTRGVDISRLNDCMKKRTDVAVESLFGSSPEDKTPTQEQANLVLSQYYTLLLGDAGRARNLVDELNALPYVEEAYIEPAPRLPT